MCRRFRDVSFRIGDHFSPVRLAVPSGASPLIFILRPEYQRAGDARVWVDDGYVCGVHRRALLLMLCGVTCAGLEVIVGRRGGGRSGWGRRRGAENREERALCVLFSI